ncbi:hypothetical protein [Kribbella shirazensis]|uniref:Uncharacterized protein n=1 Tax=Kribbella shirazensis TaxID=1105143 RepID=A0A7X6A4L0_9ACTN|nr:hypothetical protein [Kribbella shirazensis]NIK61566.1 hypothetical protein [Kribbella shirazensis]
MDLELIGPAEKFPRATLVDPPSAGYIHLAAAVEPPSGRAPFTRTSEDKAQLLKQLKGMAVDLGDHADVDRVTVYDAVVVPPPAGYARRHGVHHARYDVVVLIETTTPEAIGPVQESEQYRILHDALVAASTDLHVMGARCTKSLGDVNKSRPGLFLFNYFVAEDTDIALALWEHLAGWYKKQTGLDNSTLLQPIDKADYVFVNHARWDYGVPRLLLQQLIKPSFRSYVLTNLLVNRTGAMPLLYHLA